MAQHLSTPFVHFRASFVRPSSETIGIPPAPKFGCKGSLALSIYSKRRLIISALGSPARSQLLSKAVSERKLQRNSSAPKLNREEGRKKQGLPPRLGVLPHSAGGEEEDG